MDGSRAGTGAECAVVVLSGELDMATADAVRGAVDLALRARARSVEVRLSAVTFADSAGVRSLLEARRRVVENGVACALLGAQARVRRVARLLDVEGQFC